MRKSAKLTKAEERYQKILLAHQQAQAIFLELNRKLAKAGDAVRKAYNESQRKPV